MIHRIVIGNAVYRQAKGWKGLPKGWTEESLKEFWKDLTGERKHKVDACIEKMTGDVKNPGGFCAGLADEAARLGLFPKDWREEPRSGSAECSPCEARRAVRRQAAQDEDSYYVFWDQQKQEWRVFNDSLPYAPDHVLSSDPDLTEPELIELVRQQFGDAPVDVNMPMSPEEEYWQEAGIPEYDPETDYDWHDYHQEGPVLGPHRSDPYWSRYGAPAGGGEPAPIFEYNVEDLDQLVATALADEAVEGGDMYVTVDIRPAQQVHEDLAEVENVINDASLITTEGGEYVVEAEGGDVVVTFSADSREVKKLIAAFLEE